MKKIVVLSGSGISAESGISTFRDQGGLWENYNVDDVATPEGFQRNQKLVIEFYNELRKSVRTKQPNTAHRILAELEDSFEVVIITQNVDDLHERSGSSTVIHLHGELNKVTSSFEPNNPSYIRKLSPDSPDIKPGDLAPDGSQLRPYIVWFSEPVPNIELAASEIMTADYLIVIGTSLNVYPAAGLVDYVSDNCELFLVDPNADDMTVITNIPVKVNRIAKKATTGMQEVQQYLMNNNKEI